MSDIPLTVLSSKWEKPLDWPSWIRWIHHFKPFLSCEDSSESASPSSHLSSTEQGKEAISQCTIVVEHMNMFTKEWENAVSETIDLSGNPPSHPFPVGSIPSRVTHPSLPFPVF
jgi:hypothetical protein